MKRTFVVASRVLLQLRHDARTIALLILAPCMLETILKFVFLQRSQEFQQIGGALLGIFPLIVMFLVSSIASLRERQSGTLERLLISPLKKGEFIGGYALAFGLASLIQALVVTTFSLAALDLTVRGSRIQLMIVAILDALVGLAIGLGVSSLAKTEFQAIQFFPALLLPQLLISGLLVPTTSMPRFLYLLSKFLPMTYCVEATQQVLEGEGSIVHPILAIIAFVVSILTLGSLTLRRASK